MKINTNLNGVAVNPNEGASASPTRLAKAKAIAAGKPLESTPIPDAQVERVEKSIKKIRLKTQVSQDRHTRVEDPAPVTAETPQEVAAKEPVTDKTDDNEQELVGSEATKPLDPQAIALAKQKRSLQLREQELLAKEKALEAQSTGTKSLEEYRDRIKTNALSVLLEEGVTYDQLTEQILASNQENSDLSALKAEIKSLKEGFENQNKTLSERDAATEKQVLAQIGKDVEQLISQGEEFEAIREAKYGSKVVELIHRVYKETGEILDNAEAATLIEKELLEDGLKWAKLKKVQSQLNPTQTQQSQPVQQDRANTKVMRTLTNRDGSTSTSMSKRERAIAAMEGRLK